MTPDLLSDALDDHAHGIGARPTLAADARRGARRRQRRQRVSGLCAVVIALASAVSVAVASFDGPSEEAILVTTAPGLYEVPFREGVTVGGIYRLAPPDEGYGPVLTLAQATAARMPREFIPIDGHVAEGMLAVLTPVYGRTHVTQPTPVWHLVVKDAYPIDVRRAGVRTGGIVCDYTVDLDARSGQNLAGPASACSQEQLAVLQRLSAQGGEIVDGPP